MYTSFCQPLSRGLTLGSSHVDSPRNSHSSRDKPCKPTIAGSITPKLQLPQSGSPENDQGRRFYREVMPARVVMVD